MHSSALTAAVDRFAALQRAEKTVERRSGELEAAMSRLNASEIAEYARLTSEPKR